MAKSPLLEAFKSGLDVHLPGAAGLIKAGAAEMGDVASHPVWSLSRCYRAPVSPLLACWGRGQQREHILVTLVVWQVLPMCAASVYTFCNREWSLMSFQLSYQGSFPFMRKMFQIQQKRDSLDVFMKPQNHGCFCLSLQLQGSVMIHFLD